jgi:hypothetical protein
MFRGVEGFFDNFRLRAEAGEPDDAGFGAEPGELALGVLAGFGLHFGEGGGRGEAAGENIDGLFVTKGGEGFGGGGIESE